MDQIRNQALLSEMGIERWSLLHPDRLQGYQPESLIIDSNIKLLFVSQALPQGSEALFMQKVIQGAMSLSLEYCRHIQPNQFTQLGEHNLEWVWFCGCEPQSTNISKALHSPLLTEIDGHNQNRRALWEQIKSYE
ncbi:DNA polymerase III subunit psi [Vibrio gallicus]|uniref:DNA polymerase III subunit psi n=1 Tax=Vibrio gallicus TaxID=190897 RepID=UPI0021C30ADF|nr:DNA polymerase III subunit psi [Vibrio gallicus]